MSKEEKYFDWLKEFTANLRTERNAATNWRRQEQIDTQISTMATCLSYFKKYCMEG